MIEGTRFERVKWGERRYESDSKSKNPIFRLAMSFVHGLHNTVSLLTYGNFGTQVVYDPTLFPGSKGQGTVIARNFYDGTLKVNDSGERNLLIIPARLVHSLPSTN